MALRPLPLPAPVPGRLWLSAMPGRFDRWDSFLRQAERERLTLVACLTPTSEMEELAPDYAGAVRAGRLPFRWLQLPMPNYGVPEDPAGFRRAVAAMAGELRQGGSLLLHCAAGIGRTGTVAACLLKALGVPGDEAVQQVRAAGSNPQNALQSGLVDWF